jgi:hypothetical protein
MLECKARHWAVEAVGCVGALEYARRLKKSFFGLRKIPELLDKRNILAN